jgi:hypothetical protein
MQTYASTTFYELKCCGTANDIFFDKLLQKLVDEDVTPA